MSVGLNLPTFCKQPIFVLFYLFSVAMDVLNKQHQFTSNFIAMFIAINETTILLPVMELLK